MSSEQRPRSAPAQGGSHEGDFLSVHPPTSRGGRTQPIFHQEPTNTSSASSHNESSSASRTNPTISFSLGNGTQVNTETASAAPSSAASTESDPWKRKTLLTLDGGGIRGYSSLLVLQAVMLEVATIEREDPMVSHSAHPLPHRPRNPVRATRSRTAGPQSGTTSESTVFGPSLSSHYFPSHYFDYIAGTSTGGLIAIMLGRLHMTVDECLEAYEDLAGKVFGHPRRLHVRNSLWPKDKYNGKVLESVIEDIVKQREGSRSATFPQSNEDMCRTMVLAWQKRHYLRERVAYILRSYQHHKTPTTSVMERNPGKRDNYPISLVGRATAAAPFLFKAVKLDKDDPDLELIDGGFGANNPSEEAYREVGQMSMNDKEAVQLLLSLGTGRNLEPDRHQGSGWGMYLSYVNAAAKWATQSQATHENVTWLTQGIADYYRLNVKEGLGKMKLDEWKVKEGHKTLEFIRAKTWTYLNSPAAKKKIPAVAKQLVKIRRARSSQVDGDRWERFRHGVEYACPVGRCHQGRDRHKERRDLQRHIAADHHDHPDCSTNTMEALLDKGKRFPLHDDVEERDRTPSRDSDSD